MSLHVSFNEGTAAAAACAPVPVPAAIAAMAMRKSRREIMKSLWCRIDSSASVVGADIIF
jgi:hypothetical protein